MQNNLSSRFSPLFHEPASAYFSSQAWGSTDSRKALLTPVYAQDCRAGRGPSVGGPAIATGNAWELLITEGQDAVAGAFAVRPAGMDLRTKEGKEWQANNEGKATLTVDQMANLLIMQARMDPAFAARVQQGASDKNCQLVGRYKFDSYGGFEVQCRPDMMEDSNILDFKTTGRHLENFPRHAFELGYHVQAGWYRMVMRLLGMPDRPFHFLVTETIAPWRTVEFIPDQAWQDRGDEDAMRCLTALTRNVGMAKWEDTTAKTMSLALPKYADYSAQPQFDA